MLPTARSHRGHDTEFRQRFAIATAAVGLGLGIVFTLFPAFDLSVSAVLKSACGGDARYSGWCHENGILMIPRAVAMCFSILCIVISAYALLRSVRIGGRWGGLHQARCIFLLATFVAGPGLLANIALKDNWGRARPREVIELGGSRHFTPPLVPARQCDDNCSFVSGEASAVYAPFFAAALIVPHARVALVAGGIAAGTLTGLVRMSTGGHFLSDVLFAGVLMALTASLMHVLVVGLWMRGLERMPAPTRLAPTPRFTSSLPFAARPEEVK